MNRFELTALYHRQDLNRKCIELLNQEWPRSDGSREHSQQKSCRLSPPMSFLFIEKETDRLIGHARICLLPNRPTSCWIESVIIEQNCRGMGLGKLLMSSLEDVAKEFGFNEAYLCTDDQVAFYERCGYKKCDPILHSTTATSVFPVSRLKGPQPEVKTGALISERNGGDREFHTVHADPSGIPPPPAPPPPPAKRAPAVIVSTADHQYMRKSLS